MLAASCADRSGAATNAGLGSGAGGGSGFASKSPERALLSDTALALLQKAKEKDQAGCSMVGHGIPFPAPMCEPPRFLDKDWSARNEIPFGTAVPSGGGTWLGKDIPIPLSSTWLAILC